MKIVRKNMLALLLAASVPMTGQAAGIVSTVVTASDDIVVASSAEATVTATGRTDLISGSYPAGFRVGTWTASVTSGTIAYRFNSASNSNIVDARFADSVNTSDASKKVGINLNFTNDGTSSLINAWRVMPQGTSSLNGVINLSEAVSLSPGSYPVGIDVAAYAY
ncbi:hypothetical protein [Serratia marcescens]|uniref:hypothetical protein n=1 Tax=Serratia marcescens TaxID=615 RepID=UPI003EE38889